MCCSICFLFFFQAEDGIRDLVRSRGLGDVYKRQGVLTPFAVLEPVVVGGATVSLATLHNEGDIRRKDIRIGDTVIVQRAGEVIPQVVAPVPSLRTGAEVEFAMPAACPSCGTPVSRDESEAAVYCPCLLYTSPSPRDRTRSRMPSSA